MNAPGSGLLKVISILYIIFGAIFAVLMLLSLALGPVISNLTEGVLGGYASILGGILFVVFLIPAAVDLVIGIIGVKKAGEPSAALFFIVIGIVLAALTLLGMFTSGISIASLLGLVMPVLFIVGGFMNKNAVSSSVQA